MVSQSERFSISDLTQEARRAAGLDESQLSVRLARDYVQRVLQERPGQGKRAPYDVQVLYKLLFLLIFPEKAPQTDLQIIGKIINQLPPDVVRRVALREERLEIPDLQDPETYTRFMRGEIQPQLNERSYEVSEAGIRPMPHSAADLPTSDEGSTGWTAVKAPDNVRLMVAGEVTAKQRRQLELLARLIHELMS